MSKVKCAFCRGRGRDPFELLSELADCQVCGGTGEVIVEEPYVKCAYCEGSGIAPNTRNTCTACKGKGVVFYLPAGRAGKGSEKCQVCSGTGRTIGKSDLPCLVCRGTGLVERR